MILKYHNPVNVIFGLGSITELRSMLGRRRSILLTFPEAENLGLIMRLRRVLNGSLVAVENRVMPNPDVSSLRDTYERFWRDYAQIDVIVAVGGGSVLDTAKALMVGTRNGRFDGLLRLLERGEPFRPERVKCLIAVPSTAGTGSEVTPWATIWDRASRKKYSLHLPETWPEAAIIDPEIMLSLPRSITLQSGLDALSHALESIWNVNANPISDTLAVSAAQDVLQYLPELMENLDDRELRSRMALAALKAGLAFSNTKTALAHSISYQMTLRFGLPHGIACSFTLPMVLRRAVGIDSERDAVLAKVFGGNLDSAPEILQAFLERLGVKTDFGAYGVSESEAVDIVTHALGGARGKNFIGATRVNSGALNEQ
jgi:phosphonate metabolism-associated iron-containing alcohol dehydrogenase